MAALEQKVHQPTLPKETFFFWVGLTAVTETRSVHQVATRGLVESVNIQYNIKQLNLRTGLAPPTADLMT